MRYAPNEHLTCTLIKRKPNLEEYELKKEFFKAEIIEDIKKQKYEIISGTIATKASMVIKSSNCQHEIKADDKVICMGVERVVQYVLILLSDIDMLCDDKFNYDKVLEMAPKIIGLGA